tara:strand:+ start:753 stop:1688 length:936 start_codon:yes stop_codon:yes gene_type:complete
VKSRQVGFVLAALIAIGIAGLIIRFVSVNPEEEVLSGLLPMAGNVVTRITLHDSATEKGADLVRIGEIWTINNRPVFPPKMDQFWLAVSEIDGAQLIAENPDNHGRMGVADGQGTVVSFYLDEFLQERFIVGTWSQEVRLCYLRRPEKTDVHGIECPVAMSGIFDIEPDGWRNPVVLAIPGEEVASVTFTYPDEEFVLKISEAGWVVSDGTVEVPANLLQVETVLSVLELMVASGFATEEEAENLSFDPPDASVRIETTEDSELPATRIRFLERDAVSYYLRSPAQPTTFIMDREFMDALLKRGLDFLTGR